MAQTPVTVKQEIGQLSGTVFDTQEAVVPGATVVLFHKNHKRVLQTDGAGYFAAELPAGEYHLRVEQLGFCKAQEKEIQIEVGKTSIETIHIEALPCGPHSDVYDTPIEVEKTPLPRDITRKKIQ